MNQGSQDEVITATKRFQQLVEAYTVRRMLGVLSADTRDGQILIDPVLRMEYDTTRTPRTPLHSPPLGNADVALQSSTAPLTAASSARPTTTVMPPEVWATAGRVASLPFASGAPRANSLPCSISLLDPHPSMS